jgi:AcrB/AcrD/AcrF family
MTIGAMVGFVTLFGITMRNSMMMISHFEHLVEHEGMTWGMEAALRGASERLVPILMTSIVTALGLLPLAIGSGEAGREIEGPMAVAIFGRACNVDSFERTGFAHSRIAPWKVRARRPIYRLNTDAGAGRADAGLPFGA